MSDERTLEMHIENTHIKTLEERERKFQCQVKIKVLSDVMHRCDVIVNRDFLTPFPLNCPSRVTSLAGPFKSYDASQAWVSG